MSGIEHRAYVTDKKNLQFVVAVIGTVSETEVTLLVDVHLCNTGYLSCLSKTIVLTDMKFTIDKASCQTGEYCFDIYFTFVGYIFMSVLVVSSCFIFHQIKYMLSLIFRC